MADIFHRIELRVPADDVFRAVAQEALVETFSPDGVTMRVVELERGAHVAWRCERGPAEWVGTLISFDVAVEGEETVVRFGHREWEKPSDYLAQCSTRWARLLLALKLRLETPEPDDLWI